MRSRRRSSGFGRDLGDLWFPANPKAPDLSRGSMRTPAILELWLEQNRRKLAKDIPAALMSSSGGVEVVGPGGCLVVVGGGFEAAVEDADEAVADLA